MTQIAYQSTGRFTLLETLSSTGLATVYRGRDPSSGADVAIKVLRTYVCEDPELITYFFLEMEAVKAMADPRVLAPLEMGREEGGGAWLAFPWVSWQSLKRILAEGPLSPERARAILRQIGEILDHAHAQDVLHRNLKPANIFVSPTGEVLVGDFAMATLAQGTHPLIRSTLHTPESAYTAPDQNQGGERHAASDVYSLGVIAYELLTGTVPFPLLEPASVLVKQLNETPPLPTTLNPSLPPACDPVLLRALARHPLERYPRGGAFLDALEAALDTATAPVAPPQPPQPPVATTRFPRPGIIEETQVAGATPQEEELLCPGCGHANPQDQLYCQVCWTRLGDRPPDRPLATKEQVTKMHRRVVRELRLRRAISLGIIGAVLVTVAYNVFTTVYTPPLPTATTELHSLSAPGETAMYGLNLARTGAIAQGPTLEGAVAWAFETDRPLLSSPAVVGGVVYQTTGDRRVVALDARNGSLLWEHPTSGPIDSSPAVTGGMVYFGQRDGELVALDADTGSVAWVFSTGNPITGSPVVDQGVLYIGSGDGTMYALDAQSGEELWAFDTEQWIIASVVLHDDVILVTNSSGRVFALDRQDGDLRLDFAVDQALVSTPALADDRLYLASALGRLVAVDPLKVKYPFEGKAYYWQTQFWLWGLRDSPPVPKGLVWARNFGRRSALGAPAVLGDTLYVTLSVGELRALDIATGGRESSWTYDAGDFVHSSPMVAGPWVYIGSKDGRVHAVDRKTGEALWVLEAAKGDITTRPVMGGETLFVASRDGTLYAIR